MFPQYVTNFFLEECGSMRIWIDINDYFAPSPDLGGN